MLTPLSEEEEIELMICLLKDEWRQRMSWSLDQQLCDPFNKIQRYIILDTDRFIMITPQFYIDEINNQDGINMSYQFVRFTDCVVKCVHIDTIQYLELAHFEVIKRFSLEELNATKKM